MGISRDSLHKRRLTGGKPKAWRKKRKFELGRVSANTKLVSGGAASTVTVRRLRVRGGNFKFRALRLDSGNYSWPSQAVTRKTRILDVNYNASNNELVRTQTLVKAAVVQIDATPFRQWYLTHYGIEVGKNETKAAKEEAAGKAEVKKSKHVVRKNEARVKEAKPLDPALEAQFSTGRLYAQITSRPGQCGRADGYILEGKELDFYVKKMAKKKGKAA